MSFPEDLLSRARHLATFEKRRPKQASLRRAVSSAYYALFHLLGEAAARQAVPTEFRPYFRRALDHRRMKTVCEGFRGRSLGPKYSHFNVGNVLVNELRNVAASFVDLQKARHEADYSFESAMLRIDALKWVGDAESAFNQWKAVPASEPQRILLLMLFAVEPRS